MFQSQLRPRVLVPRIVDTSQTNAQNLNAKALLARFSSGNAEWHTLHYGQPAPLVRNNPNVVCHPLLRGRFWTWHLASKYLNDFDAIFYTGNEWYDARGLALRRLLKMRGPVIATLEGLPGDGARERQLSEFVGHRVYCFRPRSGPAWTFFHDRVHEYADHIIAISPFLERVGKRLYGDKLSVVPIGLEPTLFHSKNRGRPERPTVVGAGTLYSAKRPEVYFDLAKRFPEADFRWFGEGPLGPNLREDVRKQGLSNLSFPGAVTPEQLGEIFRNATLSVLPSFSEGVPKITQEAAACGLPVILFGFYESPSVIDCENGFVVWNDSELFDRVGELVSNTGKASAMGEIGSLMARQWDWRVVAEQWERRIIHIIENFSG